MGTYRHAALLLAGTGLAATALAATHKQDHLILTEVGVDTVRDGADTSSIYVEIFNPTDSPIVLNDGGPGVDYWLSDAWGTYVDDKYFGVALGVAPGASSTDFTITFPAGTVIPPRGTVVVCNDSAKFLDEFFGDNDGVADESPTLFTRQPGRPQLFEFTQDDRFGADGVSDMQGTSVSKWWFKLNGEFVMLFAWNGATDLVQDVDLVVFGDPISGERPGNKVNTNVDGPDPGTLPSAYLADTTLPTVIQSGDINFVQRRSAIAKNEKTTGGNGVGGLDAYSESFALASGAPAWDQSWVANGAPSPGVQLLELDGASGDALSWVAPVAVSKADGPGTASPLDYGIDGTLTELYAQGLDANKDGKNESLYLAVRGDLFGEPDNNANATMVLIDVNPHQLTTNGARTLSTTGTDLSDTDRAIDAVITKASVKIDASMPTTNNWDAAVVVDSVTDANTNQDVLTWNSTAGGSKTAFASITPSARPKFDGAVPAEFAAAPGTSHAAPDLFEAIVPVDKFGSTVTHLGLVAVTTAGNGANASPNTLPESTHDSLAAGLAPIDKTVCWDVANARPIVVYVDADNDTYGDPNRPSSYCGPNGKGFSADATDCDDTDYNANPGMEELCDGVDNDCDGLVDDDDPDAPVSDYYPDADGDGYGSPVGGVTACDPPPGYVSDRTDCLDTNAAVNRIGVESCNGLDDDCDGKTDDADSPVQGRLTWYLDVDNDDHGLATSTTLACQDPSGAQSYAAVGDDCDDTRSTVHPGAAEVCDTRDNDCDTLTDDADPGVTDQTRFYADSDGDTYGNAAVSALACFAGAGQVTDATDCDDTRNAVHPGATEVCNLRDDDCDTLTDDADPGVDGDVTVWRDADSDGQGLLSDTKDVCVVPAGWVTNSQDCLDTDAAVKVGATEQCNSRDDDCDGTIDDNPPGPLWYIDADGDDFGAGDPVARCTPPTYGVDAGGDCLDTDKSVYPGAPELADGQDNDCDGHDETYDADGDGLDVLDELALGTSATDSDSDDDGLSDGGEVDEGTDPLVADTDEDGLGDGDEIARGTDPLFGDTDEDGLADGDEVDAGADPLDTDSDNDGLTDGDEAARGTDPTVRDTDGDGVKDSWEVRDGTDPLDPSDWHDDAYDRDGDGLPDHAEYALGTDPDDTDSDDDGIMDGAEDDTDVPVDTGGDTGGDTDTDTDADTDTDTDVDTDTDADTDTDTDADTDTAHDTADVPIDPPGCGCATGDQTPWVWAFGLALLARRRRVRA